MLEFGEAQQPPLLHRLHAGPQRALTACKSCLVAAVSSIASKILGGDALGLLAIDIGDCARVGQQEPVGRRASCRNLAAAPVA